MLISNINRFGCQKVCNIFNAVGCCNFGTLFAGQLNISNLLIDSLKCKCIHRIPAHYQQLRYFHQTSPIQSSQSISKSETEDKDEQQLHQPSVEEEKQEDKKINTNQQQELAKNYTSIGPYHNLNIKCQQGGSGQKYIRIQINLQSELPGPIVHGLPKIHVPQEAYKFIKVMDRLIGQLPAEKPENPQTAGTQPSPTESDGDGSPPVLTIQTVEGGLHYDFKLSVEWHPEIGKRKLEIRSVKTVQEHKEKWLRMPLWALFWLREQMASMLVEYDGSEQIDESPTMPEWAKARNLRPATLNKVSAQLQQQRQQLAQLQTQLAQLTSAMTMNIHNNQTSSFNPDGFIANPTTPLNPPLTPATQLIDQLKKANGTAAADAVQSKQQRPPKNRKKD